RHRNTARRTAQHFLRLHAGRLVDHAEIRRQRTRPDNRRTAGRADGRQSLVESEPGVGSTFYFTAALGLPPAASNENESRKDGGLDLSGVLALVVDDN